jgi:hypothetical protein
LPKLRSPGAKDQTHQKLISENMKLMAKSPVFLFQ